MTDRAPPPPLPRNSIPPTAPDETTPEAPERMDAPGTPADGPGGGVTPAEVPAAPRAPGSAPTVPPPDAPRDPWRDRLRVVWDRAVYLAVIVVVYRLRMADKLDPYTGAGLLLLAGVRLENLAEFVLRRAAVDPNSRAAALLVAGGRLGIDPDAFRSWFRG